MTGKVVGYIGGAAPPGIDTEGTLALLDELRELVLANRVRTLAFVVTDTSGAVITRWVFGGEASPLEIMGAVALLQRDVLVGMEPEE